MPGLNLKLDGGSGSSFMHMHMADSVVLQLRPSMSRSMMLCRVNRRGGR